MSDAKRCQSMKCLIPFTLGSVDALGVTPLLIQDSGARQRKRRRRADSSYSPTLEMNWKTPEDEAKAIELCGNDLNCQFDYFVTKNEELANATLQMGQTFENDEAILGKD